VIPQIVNPEDWMRPRGYSNGIVAQGRYLCIAGQIGWDERHQLAGADMAAQTERALRNVVAVLTAAGGKAEHLVRLTWYVTDKQAYTAALRAIGEAYRATVGDHYPAMTLVQVADLLEDGALVEIEATAVLPGL
jgi:enamine deaminase RidA (YjgF/YER057c/UK114 family)